MKKHSILSVCRSAFVLLFVGVLAIQLSGCTSKKGSSAPKGYVRLYSKTKIKGFDPALSEDLYSATEVQRVYEPLLQYNYIKRPYELEPLLAESMPEISADGKKMTFKLKKGVMFTDDAAFVATQGKGREMKAKDLVYSFLRIADPRLVSPMWWIFDSKIVGLNEWRAAQEKAAKTDFDVAVEGFKAVDDYTLEINLIQPNYQMIYVFAMPNTSVVAREVVEKYGREFISHAVGTGPHMLKDYNPVSRILYVKNPGYRTELFEGKKLPLNEGIEVAIMVEAQPRWLNFLQGNLDLIEVPKDNYDQAFDGEGKVKPEFSPRGFQVYKNPETDLTKDCFNMSDPIVGKNKLLRQALAMALNPAEFVRLFYAGQAVPAQGPIPPTLTGYDPEFKNPYRVYSVEKAKEFLAKAGYPGGKGLPELEYTTVSDSQHRQINEWIEKQWAQLGVKVRFQPYSWPEFLANMRRKRGQFWDIAWKADYPDAENFLALFYTKYAGGVNDTYYSNPEYDKLYDEALKLPDSPKRTELYKKMSAIVAEDMPVIFQIHRIRTDLVQPWLKNYKYHEFDHGVSKYYELDESKRK